VLKKGTALHENLKAWANVTTPTDSVGVPIVDKCLAALIKDGKKPAELCHDLGLSVAKSMKDLKRTSPSLGERLGLFGGNRSRTSSSDVEQDRSMFEPVLA